MIIFQIYTLLHKHLNKSSFPDNPPQTLMGQFMEALNSQTNIEDININLESFPGGLECNVDEVSNAIVWISLNYTSYLPRDFPFQGDKTRA